MSSRVESLKVRGKAVLRRHAPRLAGWIRERRSVKVKDGWERYARSIAPGAGVHLGDEWNQPESIGLECEASAVVQTIDEQVIAPFLGTVDTALEIGAGGGRFTVTLVPKARRVIASEVAPSMLRHLRAVRRVLERRVSAPGRQGPRARVRRVRRCRPVVRRVHAAAELGHLQLPGGDRARPAPRWQGGDRAQQHLLRPRMAAVPRGLARPGGRAQVPWLVHAHDS